MTIDVSVVVPFFNPGANIDDCLASLVAQTLPRHRLEAILVDDGSTDGSDVRVAEWVARHPDLFTTTRIPASGGPARPRNVGIDQARGRYIQFLDSDDTLTPRTLERQLAVADESAADIVVGKLASDFRGIWHPLFRKTVTGKTLADYPLIQNLTVCKMFRREFLAEHSVRFPEGPRYIEDQQICVQAYAHAESVAVVADIICYLYRRRRVGGRNHGDTTIVPADYCRELAAIFDVIDDEANPAARDSSLARYYRGEMLGRLRGPEMLGYRDSYRQELYDEVRRLALDRIPETVHAGLPVFIRSQSQLLLDDRLDGLLDSAGWMEKVRLAARAELVGWRDGRLVLDLDAELRYGDEPLELDREGGDWLVPPGAAPGLDGATRRLGDLSFVDVDLATVSRADGQLWSTTDGLALTIDDAGVPRVRGRVEIDLATVMGGTRLDAGLWDLRLRVMFGGLTRSSPLRSPAESPDPPPVWLSHDHHSVIPYWTAPTASRSFPTLALDVDEWMHPLTEHLRLAPPRIDGRHRLVVPVDGVAGQGATARPVTVLLEPLGVEAAPVLSVAAELRAAPAHSEVVANLRPLPKPADRWALWLRLGLAGGPPATPLGTDISRGRFGRLVAVTAADETA